MNNNSFHEYNFNSEYLNKVCCNKSYVCYMGQHIYPCALQENSSAWRRHAEESSSENDEGHVWNFQNLSNVQHPYSSDDGNRSLDPANASERDKGCELSTSCLSTMKYPWMRETHAPMHFSSINAMESGERTLL